VSPAPRSLRLARDGETPQASCPHGVCDGSGWILGPDDLARPCQCREQKLARKRTTGVSTAIPRRYQGVSFDRPPLSDLARAPGTAPVARAVRSFAEEIDAQLDEGKGLWLWGDVGTGKTSMAMAVSKAAVEAGRTVAIYSLPRLLARIRRTYDSAEGEDSYLEFFDRLASVDLLHLDDLGAEKRSDWVLEQLYAIVDERYQSQRSVVVTTNLPLHELEEQVGPRTVSRLVEICGDPLPLNGEDLRFHVRPA
jgi:DNA replication protein DnaC